jgi:hypothetical protein
MCVHKLPWSEQHRGRVARTPASGTPAAEPEPTALPPPASGALAPKGEVAGANQPAGDPTES